MLIHPDEKVHVVAAEPAIPRDRVGTDLLVRMSDVRLTVRVIDRRREKVLAQLRFLSIGGAAPAAGTIAVAGVVACSARAAATRPIAATAATTAATLRASLTFGARLRCLLGGACHE
jgi:hypothetical protein